MLRSIARPVLVGSIGFAIACGSGELTKDDPATAGPGDGKLTTLFSPVEAVEAPADVEAMIAITGSACGDGFHLQGEMCISSVLTCRVVNERHELVGHGESQWNGSAWGPCSMKSCAPGFEHSGERCVRPGSADGSPQPEPRECTNYGADRVPIGKGTQEWDDGRWGPCRAKSCYEDYRLEYKRCASNRMTCQIRDVVDGERVVIALGSRVWQDGRWSACTYTSCAEGYELEDGSCTPTDEQRDCKLQDGDQEVGTGTQTWSERWGWGSCVAKSCVDGYHAESRRCRKNTETCSLRDYDASGRRVTAAQGERRWVDGKWQPCRFESCPTGWAADGGTCVPQVEKRSCPVYEMGKPSTPRGTGERTWTGRGSIGWSRCEVLSCHEGFHPFSSYCQPNTRTCTARDEVGGEPTVIATGKAQWSDGRWGRCVFTSCLDGYELVDGYCTPPQTTRDCDVLERDTVVGHGTQGWSGTGWGRCEPKTCVDGYHLEYERYCRSNTRDCRASTGMGSVLRGVAELGRGAIGEGQRRWDGERWGPCIYTSCAEGYELSEGQCNPTETERDCELRRGETVIGTGKLRWQQTAWSRCLAERCVDGYHLDSERCLANVVDCQQRVYQDSRSVVVAEGTRTWTDGSYSACALTSCVEGWKMEAGACVPLQTTRTCKLMLGRNETGAGTQSWERGRWSRCNPSSCSDAYHLEEQFGRNYCRANTVSCNAYDEIDGKRELAARGTKTWNGTQYAACIITFCKEGWETSDGTCNPPERERRCELRSGTTVIGAGRQRWGGRYWDRCEATSCEADYALHNERCYPRTRKCYSYYQYRRAGTGTQRWEDRRYGACQELTCNEGYEPRDGACVPPDGNATDPGPELGSRL